LGQKNLRDNIVQYYFLVLFIFAHEISNDIADDKETWTLLSAYPFVHPVE
jgi:hypothetical protein